MIHLSEVSFITLGMVQGVISKFIQKTELLINCVFQSVIFKNNNNNNNNK